MILNLLDTNSVSSWICDTRSLPSFYHINGVLVRSTVKIQTIRKDPASYQVIIGLQGNEDLTFDCQSHEEAHTVILNLSRVISASEDNSGKNCK